MSRIYAIAAVCLVIAMTAGVFVYTRLAGTPDKYAQCRTTNIAGGASQIGGPFTLVDETGKTVTDADVIDQPSLIYFGYTFCPDVCPLDTSRNAEAIDILEERGLMVKPVFISIDPERDTPEVVDAFTANLHERMLGLTGSPEQVRAASRAYRTFYQKQESDDEYYLVDHSTMSYLVFPEDGFVEVFQRSLRAEDVADRIQCFLEAR
jgi:protein SCO1/2